MPEVKTKITAVDKASPKLKGLTKSMIGAQLAVGALQGATRALVDAGKKAIENFKAQEQAEAKLRAAVGGNIGDLKKFASELQNITTVGDESTLELLRLASSMGVAREELTQAAQDATAFSKALGIGTTSALKLVQQAQAGNTSSLERYIPALRSANTEAEKQALIQETIAKGMRVAQAEAETYTGRVIQLKNAQGDLSEKAGQFVAVIGKDFVEAQLNATNAINDFLTSSEGIDKISSSLAGIKTAFVIVKDIAGQFSDTLRTSLEPIITTIRETIDGLTEDTGQNIDGFLVLANVVQGLGTAFRVFGALAIAPLKDIKNGFDAIVLTVESVAASFEFLKKRTPESLAAFRKATEESKKSAIEFGKNIGGINDVIKIMQEEAANSAVNIETNAAKWRDAFNKTKASITKDLTDIGTKGTDTADELGDAGDKAANSWDKAGMAIKDGLLSSLNTGFSAAQELTQRFFDDQLATVQNGLNSQIEAIDSATQARLEREGLAEESTQQRLKREIQMLQQNLSMAKNAEEKDAQRSEILEKQNELKKTKIVEQAEAQKTAAQKAAAKKEQQLKVDQFNANKGFQIGQVWINTAQGIASAWASSMQLGPIAGPIAGGILTGLLLTNAGIQTGVIASQSPPSQSFVDGGQSRGGLAVVGERGREIVNTNPGDTVLNNAQTEGLLGGMSINIDKVVTDSPRDFIDQMIEIQRFELARG